MMKEKKAAKPPPPSIFSSKWEKLSDLPAEEDGFSFHTLTTLGPGMIAAVKGDGSIMVFQKSSKQWSSTYQFRKSRVGCAAIGVVDDDGNTKHVFVFGGGPSCETVFKSSFLFDYSAFITRATTATSAEEKQQQDDDDDDDEDQSEDGNLALSLPDMLQERTGFAAVYFSVHDKKYIAVIGGESQNMECLDSLEVMDVSTRTWIQPFSPTDVDVDDEQGGWPRLKVPRKDLAATCVLGGNVMVIGGRGEEDEELDSVEMLDLGRVILEATTTNTPTMPQQQQEWETMQETMSTKRADLGATVIPCCPSENGGEKNNEFVLVVAGGRRTNSVEAYHSRTKKWSPLPSLEEDGVDCRQLVLLNDDDGKQYSVATGNKTIEMMSVKDAFHSSNADVVHSSLSKRKRE